MMTSIKETAGMKPPKMEGILKLTRSVAFLGIAIILYHFVVRTWMLDWGAPEKIQKLSLPGDSLSRLAPHHSRAVLIKASPEQIWPWIMQLGQERGGFYSYTWLENVFAADMHNINALTPSLQKPRIEGDTIWLATRRHYHGQGYEVLALVNPIRSFVMVDGSDYERLKKNQDAYGFWAIYLYPEDSGSTWLIARSCYGGSRPVHDKVLRYVFLEVPHFIMEQKMLRTIRNLTEQ